MEFPIPSTRSPTIGIQILDSTTGAQEERSSIHRPEAGSGVLMSIRAGSSLRCPIIRPVGSMAHPLFFSLTMSGEQIIQTHRQFGLVTTEIGRTGTSL